MKKECLISLPGLAKLLADSANNERILVALVGPPGAGKSTIAEQLLERLNTSSPHIAAIFPMDGYHLDDSVLIERGLRSRKGAPETFDVEGLRHMLERLRWNRENEVAVPVFDRALEIARAGARMISKDMKILIVEGNYLLLKSNPWSSLARFFDLTVSIQVSEEELRSRLMRRWLTAGATRSEAHAHVEANDLPNGRLVLVDSMIADYRVEVSPVV